MTYKTIKIVNNKYGIEPFKFYKFSDINPNGIETIDTTNNKYVYLLKTKRLTLTYNLITFDRDIQNLTVVDKIEFIGLKLVNTKNNGYYTVADKVKVYSKLGDMYELELRKNLLYKDVHDR